MNKILIGFLIIASIGGIVLAQTITTRINKIDVDFNRNIATVEIGSGYYSQSNAWIPTGLVSEATIQEPAFDQLLNTLESENSLNMNALMTTLSNELSPQTMPVLSTNVNWDEVARLKASGFSWSDITSTITGINWQAVSALNNLQGTNWTSLTGINWNNWFTAEGQGQNWEQFIKTGGN